MGYYIELPSPKNKAEQIKKMYGGLILPEKPEFSKVPPDKAVIVILDNGSFEAAGYAYDEYEFNAFTEPDDKRKKEFVIMDKAKAEELTHYVRR